MKCVLSAIVTSETRCSCLAITSSSAGNAQPASRIAPSADRKSQKSLHSETSSQTDNLGPTLIHVYSILLLNARRQYFVSKMEEGSSPNQPKSTVRSGPFHRTFTTKVIKLRENYIIDRNKDDPKMKRQVQELLSSPKFNRFISLAKCNLAGNEGLLEQYQIQEEKERRPLQSNYNRRQIHFMRQRRPDHNSPLKTRAEDLRRRELSKIEEKQGKQSREMKQEKREDEFAAKDEAENKQLIRQMVTHVEQKHKVKKLAEDPYYPRGSYYIAEVLKQYQNTDSLAWDHLDNSIYFLQLFAKYQHTASQPAVQPLTLRRKEKYLDKMTVVFDLDETLVHCFEDRSQPHQLQLPVKFAGGGTMLAPLNIRPGARELLAELAQSFQLMIFTASHQSYADQVINFLDPQRNYVQHRLYRRNCQSIGEGYYVKDLRVLGRDLSKVVLVDNAAYSYCFQVANGIPILPYYQGDTDFQLAALKDYLLALQGDVRQTNRRTFRLEEYSKYSEVAQLVEQLYLAPIS